jgi:pimeloyl-ACP methyl ester carboxylesterase
VDQAGYRSSVATSAEIRPATVRANGLTFGILEAGRGPLALCLHGFPDTAWTWQHLLPELAAAGFHAVAPFMRGYAPTGIPADRGYAIADLAADACALHDALGGGQDAVLIGSDWGAEAAYAAAASAPGRWRRLVTLAIPPAGMDDVLLTDYDQLRRFFYLFLLQDDSGLAENVAARDDMAFLDRLWQDWSPGFDGSGYLARVKESLRAPEHLTAAIAYYRATNLGESGGEPATAPQPTLYLHGTRDGCIGADLVRGAAAFLSPGSRLEFIPDAGHFLHAERPAEVNPKIVGWVS